MLTKTQILKLRPKFEFNNNIIMVDWFEIVEDAGFFCIKSGLRHADGEIKSPFYYDSFIGGKNSKIKSLKAFNEWWCSLNMFNRIVLIEKI